MFGQNQDGHMHGVEGQVQKSSQCGTVLSMGVVEEDVPIARHFHRVW